MTLSRNQKFLVQPGGCLRGRLRVPGDKSISHRAIMLGSLAEGITEVTGFLEGEDSLATLSAFRRMGVRIDGPDGGQVVIHGVGMQGLDAPEGPLDLGNSGTSMRLLCGLLAGQGFEVTLTGDSSLSARPMRRVTDPLTEMGASIESTGKGTAPLRIRPVKQLQGIDYRLPVASAQVKSSLLLAALYAVGETCITEPAPTRDHTERMLSGFGYSVRREESKVCVTGGGRLRARKLDVPADISSAAFFLVGASIAGGSDLTLEHVGINPTRVGVINILRLMGADIEVLNKRNVGGEPVADLWVRSSRLRGIRIPEEQVPLAIDEFPALFVAAAYAEGETVLTGAGELRVKESDRIQAMSDGLTALGVDARPTPDGMVIKGGRIQGGSVDSHGDHRIAMAFAMAGLRAAGEIVVSDCANVNTSFPAFVPLAKRAGLAITDGMARVITIDGPSGSGKGTISHLLAERLGWHMLDSGALYRVLALAAEREGLSLQQVSRLTALARTLNLVFHGDKVLLDGEDVSSLIRTETCGNAASRIAAVPEVRAALLEWQRACARPPGLVADGRDMGSVVFPGAEVKIFLTASAEERARRRYNQLKEKGLGVSLPDLVKDIRERDERDRSRSVAPLRAPAAALEVESTILSIEEVLERVLERVQQTFPDL